MDQAKAKFILCNIWMQFLVKCPKNRANNYLHFYAAPPEASKQITRKIYRSHIIESLMERCYFYIFT